MSAQILLVDDDADIRDAVRDALEVAGYAVECAADGQQALQRLAKPELPRLVLLDLVMPVIDGAEVLRIIRADERLRRIPVVVFTAATGEPEPEGAASSLRKPIGLQDLLGVVARYCD